MLHQMLATVAMALTAGTLTGTSAGAADLPEQSRLGAIFAEPSEALPPAIAPVDRSDEIPARVILYTLGNGLFARGGYNYGSPYSYFYNGPYYGGPYASNAPRLPYVCGLLGYC
jgi:hypothetical protein